MSEPMLARETPLIAGSLLNMRGVGRIEAVAPASRFIFRGQAAAPIAGASFGVTLPQAVCRAAVAGARAALWLGPDEWLLLAPESEGLHISADLMAALPASAASLVDISHRQVGLELTGPRISQLINAGCPLDLDLANFPVDMCTRTIFAKAEIVLWRRARDVFQVEVWRSFALYVADVLKEASLGVTNP
jgi:sarcosine oxidase, subunit gamma